MVWTGDRVLGLPRIQGHTCFAVMSHYLPIRVQAWALPVSQDDSTRCARTCAATFRQKPEKIRCLATWLNSQFSVITYVVLAIWVQGPGLFTCEYKWKHPLPHGHRLAGLAANATDLVAVGRPNSKRLPVNITEPSDRNIQLADACRVWSDFRTTAAVV